MIMDYTPYSLFTRVLLIGIFSSSCLHAQKSCNDIIQLIEEEYPWIDLSIEQKAEINRKDKNCTTERCQSLDSLYYVLSNTPDLKQKQKKYVIRNIKRINEKYGTHFEMSEADWIRVRFFEGGDLDCFIGYLENYAIEFRKTQNQLDSIAEYERRLYDSIIRPQILAAQSDEERKAIAEKYPSLVRFVEGCGSSGENIE